ncbi:hypothetical protein OG948_54150 (plasmid) [Embleya sp. NBC_00888]|uniref:hypothetical protein n=1 Tax=Embleya sp. NBC_00888 TaxID=2975960 RepID=UPI002F912AF1|nr:hypothetical protein OG948_54150 [Embleya sp. NBC_00888]
MTSDPDSVAESGQEAVVVAAFDDHRSAEHMPASLGRDFRRKARKDGTTAFVITGNTDGSLKLTRSRVLTASGLTHTLMAVSLAWTIGLVGLRSMWKGAKDEVHAVHARQGHVGAQEQAREILAEAGPHAAVTLVRCADRDTRQTVAAAAADCARRSWDGTLTDFLAALDPGSAHDWVRAALGEPTGTNR